MISKRQMYGVFISALAVMSLYVSSISACACSHHQQTVEDTASCHIQSHSGHSETAQITDTKTSIDEGCTCFVNVPSPYVLAKSGKKKVGEQGPVAEIPVSSTFAEQDFETVEFQPQPIAAAPSHYLSLLAISKPSRAPPRL